MMNAENAEKHYVDEIRRDRMRFEKNKLSSTLAIWSIVFNAIFFVSVYQCDVGTYYYNILIGASIVYNLLFMLIVFLIAEGSKNYIVTYSYIAIPVAVLQFVRIFVYPVQAHKAMVDVSGVATQAMSDGKFTRAIFYLVVSGICLIGSAGIGIWKCSELKKHMASLESK